MRVLSIRQPWAWLIVQGHKEIENRSWATRYRGPLLIHASARPAPHLLRLRTEIRARFGLTLPDQFELGGLVGIADLTDCVAHSTSPWYEGLMAWHLTNARPLPFVPLLGRLGLFEPPEELCQGLRTLEAAERILLELSGVYERDSG